MADQEIAEVEQDFHPWTNYQEQDVQKIPCFLEVDKNKQPELLEPVEFITDEALPYVNVRIALNELYTLRQFILGHDFLEINLHSESASLDYVEGRLRVMVSYLEDFNNALNICNPDNLLDGLRLTGAGTELYLEMAKAGEKELVINRLLALEDTLRLRRLTALNNLQARIIAEQNKIVEA